MKQYFIVLGKYADFTGRARRKEYWTFSFFNWLFTGAVVLLDNILMTTFDDQPYGWFYLIYYLIVLLPILAVSVRRLHDVGKSGWWWFIILIPFIGSIWLFVLSVTEGDQGPNQYGPDPKQLSVDSGGSYGSEIPADSIPCPDSGRMYNMPSPFPAIQEDFVPPPPIQPQRKQPTGSPKAEYAYSLLRIGQKQQALPVLKELVREEPDNEKAWLSLYLCVDRKEQQKYCLQQALRINPGNKKAQQRLGKLYIPADAVQNGDNSGADKNTPLICAQCKMPLSPDSLFCENCGNPVIEEDTLLDDPLPPARFTGAQYPAGVIQQNAWNPPPVYAQPQIQPEKKPGAGRVFLAFLIMLGTHFILSFGQGFLFTVIYQIDLDYGVIQILFLITRSFCAFFTPLVIREMKIRRWQASLGLILIVALDILIDILRWGMGNIEPALITLVAGMLGVFVFVKSRRKLAAAAPRSMYISPTVQPIASVPEAKPKKSTAKRILSGIGLSNILFSITFPWVFEISSSLFGTSTESMYGYETTEGIVTAVFGLLGLILLNSIDEETPAHLWATFVSLIAAGITYSFTSQQNTGETWFTYTGIGLGPYLVFGGAALVLICILIPSRKTA